MVFDNAFIRIELIKVTTKNSTLFSIFDSLDLLTSLILNQSCILLESDEQLNFSIQKIYLDLFRIITNKCQKSNIIYTIPHLIGLI
jgi:hypothetical protein